MIRSNWIKWTTVATLLTSVVPTYAFAEGMSYSGTTTSSVLLENLGFQAWSTYLIKGKSSGPLLEGRRLQELSVVVDGVSRVDQVIPTTLQALGALRLSESGDYVRLAKSMLSLRQNLRYSKNLEIVAKRKVLFLLQMMAEEALYVGSRKFSDFPDEVSLVSKSVTTLPEVGRIREFTVQSGDILLSKSSGSGSSSLIALSMDEPHIFSHSTPVYVDKGNALSPEAFIEDGVKLRDLQADYASHKKTRLYVYRLKAENALSLPLVERSMKDLVSEMQTRTSGKADQVAAFGYDFTMTPGEVESRGLFCSSVGYEVYSRAGLSDELNPYSRSTWSSISGPRHFLLEILGVQNQSVPAPGDIEVNTNYELVGVRVNVTKLAQERVELALFDILIDEVLKEDKTLQDLAFKLKALDEKPVSKEKIVALAKKGVIPASFAPQLQILDKIPNNIKISQLVLFGFMNEVMTPKIRTSMLAQIEARQAGGYIVSAPELRDMLRLKAGDIRKVLAEMNQKMDLVVGE